MRGMKFRRWDCKHFLRRRTHHRSLLMKARAMLGDPAVRKRICPGSVARGWKQPVQCKRLDGRLMGMGVGMNAGGGFMGAASANMQQMR